MSIHIYLGGLDKKTFDYLSKTFKSFTLLDSEKINFNTTKIDIFILDYNGDFTNSNFKKILKVSNTNKIILTRENKLANFELYQKHKIDHILGINEDEFLEELSNTITSILQNKNQYLDLLKKADNTWTLDNPNTFRESINKSILSIDFSNYFSEIPKLVELALEETVTNALIHAPVDQKGTPLFKSIKEVKSTPFKKKQFIKIHTKMTDNFFMFSLTDQYGSLDPEIIKKYLSKGVDQIEYESKPSGAGLGFCLVFNYATKFIIDIRPGVSTTISIFFKNSKSSKKYFLFNKSFHVFKYQQD